MPGRFGWLAVAAEPSSVSLGLSLPGHHLPGCFGSLAVAAKPSCASLGFSLPGYRAPGSSGSLAIPAESPCDCLEIGLPGLRKPGRSAVSSVSIGLVREGSEDGPRSSRNLGPARLQVWAAEIASSLCRLSAGFMSPVGRWLNVQDALHFPWTVYLAHRERSVPDFLWERSPLGES